MSYWEFCVGNIIPRSFILGRAFHRSCKPPFYWFVRVIAWVRAIVRMSCQGLVLDNVKSADTCSFYGTILKHLLIAAKISNGISSIFFLSMLKRCATLLNCNSTIVIWGISPKHSGLLILLKKENWIPDLFWRFFECWISK